LPTSETGKRFNESADVLSRFGLGGLDGLYGSNARKQNADQRSTVTSEYLKQAAVGRNEPLSVGERNNNYGNIRATDEVWEGSNGSKDGFVVFDTPEAGFIALGKTLRTYRKKGFDTVEKILNRYAPPTENPTDAYIENVAKLVGNDAGEKLTEEDMVKVMEGIFTQETVGGRDIKMKDIIKGWKDSA
jgi:hypothetical protein